MPRLLRTVKHGRWIAENAEAHLAVDDVPSDPLADLTTKENLLSVWVVNEDGSNIERIVRAVGIGRQELAHIGYVVFDAASLADAGIEIIENSGESCDHEANAWHRDLALSGNKVVALAKTMFRHGEIDVVLKQRMEELVKEGLNNGQLPDLPKFRKFVK